MYKVLFQDKTEMKFSSKTKLVNFLKNNSHPDIISIKLETEIPINDIIPKEPEELQEADFGDMHIKVGDMVEFSYCDEDFTERYWGIGRMKSITQTGENIMPVIVPIADNRGNLLKEKDYNPKTCPKEVSFERLSDISTLLTKEVFDKVIEQENKLKETHKASLMKELTREYNKFCKEQDKYIKNLKVLKEMV